MTARLRPARITWPVTVLALAAIALVATACSGSSKPATTPTVAAVAVADPRPVGPIAHEGHWLTDASGRVLMLHGTNMVSKGAPYYPAAAGFDDDDGAWLEANGFDVVRLGVMATALMPEPGMVSDTYLDQIGQTVDMLARHHILVLLDFHQDGWGESVGSDGFPGWMTLTGNAQNTHTTFPLYYVTNPAIQAAFQSFWDNAPGPGGAGIRDQFDVMAHALASRFGGAPNVLGYDLINEPWPGTTWEPCGANADGCPGLDRTELDAFYASATHAIRASDRQHLVFGEPFVLFNFGNAPTNIALPGGDANTGLSFHVYPLSPDGVPRVLKNAEAWAQGTGGALLETEWGATDDAPVITQQADAFDEALVPWIFWTYDENMVRDLHKPPTGDNLVASTVGAVVRPHPLAIAGTPTRVHYDPATRTLEVSWSATMPDGRQLPTGTVTSIELPASVYHGAYKFTATGAKRDASSNSTMLTFTNEPGADGATVTISPDPTPVVAGTP